MYILFFALTVITMLILQLYGSKKKYIINNYEVVINYIKEMCYEYKIDVPKIEKGNNFSFNPIKNIVYIKKEVSNNLEYFTAALHEAGHYIVYNNNSYFLNKITKATLPILMANRIVVIPAYVTAMLLTALEIFDPTTRVSIILFKKIFMCVFIIASIIRLTVGIYNEVKADYYVLKFLGKRHNEVNIINVKTLMSLALVSQLLNSLAWIFMIIYIYKVLFGVI